MDIRQSIYRTLHYFFPDTFPLAPPPRSPEELQEDANNACWQDIYSDACARLSDLSEASGGINVRRELMDLDARIRPLLNNMIAEQEQNGGFCADPASGEINYTPSCGSPETGCLTALQCNAANDPAEATLQIFFIPEDLFDR